MATITDVAEESGLSVGTVSRVLNNRGYISEKTRLKVNEAMKKLHYQPNELARSLSKQSSSIIGVVVPKLDNPYFSSLTEYIEEFASSKGLQILLFVSNGNKEKEEELIDLCKKHRVAGIIICSGLFSLEAVKNLDCPLITIERNIGNTATASIECDNYEGGKLAGEHLIQKGCKYLLHLSGVVGNEMSADKRAQGFIDVCKKYGVTHLEVPFSNELYERMEYLDFLKEIFALHPDIDGVFASNDIIGAQVMQICKEFNRNVPEKVKVIGFDDIPLAKWTIPALTTIHQPIKEMAKAAVNMLHEANNGVKKTTNITMSVALIERNST